MITHKNIFTSGIVCIITLGASISIQSAQQPQPRRTTTVSTFNDGPDHGGTIYETIVIYSEGKPAMIIPKTMAPLVLAALDDAMAKLRPLLPKHPSSASSSSSSSSSSASTSSSSRSSSSATTRLATPASAKPADYDDMGGMQLPCSIL